MPTDIKKAGAGSPGNRKKRRPLKPGRIIVLCVSACIVIYFVYVLIWQQIAITKKNKEIEELLAQIETVQSETEKLQKEIESLNDPEYIEDVARNQLGLVRPNERVFVDSNKSSDNTGK